MTLDSPSNEETPLLSKQPKHHIISFSQAHSPRVITVIVLVTLFWLEFGGYMMAVPGLRIYEDIICNHYYDHLQGEGHVVLGGKIDESMCKRDDIQNELSIIVAGSHFLEAIPTLIMTIPYGMLMDRIGRKPVFMLAMTGNIMDALWRLTVMWFWRTLPLRLVWLGPLFTLIGGGIGVGSMAFYAIISDITPEASRTDVFFVAAATNLLAELIAPAISAVLMTKSPWIPFVLGAVFLTFGSLLVLFIPETLHIHTRTISPLHLTPYSSNSDSPSSIKPQSSMITSIKHQFSNSLRILISSISILSSAPIILLLLTFVVRPFSIQSIDISLRYISNRFQFPLRLSSFLWSLRAGVQIILFLLILPFLSHLITTRFQLPSAKTDLYLGQASILILTFGAILLAASPTLSLAILGMAIFTLGEGYISLIRSLITTLVDQQHKGQLYAAVAVIETVGKLVAGPAFAQLYIVGLRWKGAWVGLPFFGLGVLCGLAGVGAWSAGWVLSRRGWEWKRDEGLGVIGDIEEEEEAALIVERSEEAVVGGIKVLNGF